MEASQEVKTTYNITLDREELDELLGELSDGFLDEYLNEDVHPALYVLLQELKRVSYAAGGIINPNNIYINHDHNCTHHPYRFSGWERLDNDTQQ